MAVIDGILPLTPVGRKY